MGGTLRKISPLAVSIAMLASTAALAGDEKFDSAAPGTLPADWICGVTGKGSPVWKVEADPSAPSKPNVLKQSGNGTFPWCVKQSAQITDGFVEVRFKPLAGREDQAGGLIWRFKDANNYYLARANALENNVSLYHTQNGQRITIKYVNAPVAGNNGTHCASNSRARRSRSRSTASNILPPRTIRLPGRAPLASGPRRTASPRSMIFPMGATSGAAAISL